MYRLSFAHGVQIIIPRVHRRSPRPVTFSHFRMFNCAYVKFYSFRICHILCIHAKLSFIGIHPLCCLLREMNCFFVLWVVIASLDYYYIKVEYKSLHWGTSNSRLDKQERLLHIQFKLFLRIANNPSRSQLANDAGDKLYIPQ